MNVFETELLHTATLICVVRVGGEIVGCTLRDGHAGHLLFKRCGMTPHLNSNNSNPTPPNIKDFSFMRALGISEQVDNYAKELATVWNTITNTAA